MLIFFNIKYFLTLFSKACKIYIQLIKIVLKSDIFEYKKYSDNIMPQVKPDIETFAKMRELSRNIKELTVTEDKAMKDGLLKKSGEIIAEILEDDLKVTDTETFIEVNFAVLKFRHTIKKKKN